MTTVDPPEDRHEAPRSPARGRSEIESVLDAVGRSTAEKATEIVLLRRRVVERYGPCIAACAGRMAERFAAGGRLFTFGNGGSSTDAQGAAAAFSAPARGRPLPALCLSSDFAVITALPDDATFEEVFARQLAALGRSGDIALGLSAKGGPANVARALEEASRQGLLTIALTGHGGGRLAELDGLDHLFVIPSASVHRVQEAQATVCHVLWELTQQALGALPPLGDLPAAPEGDRERAGTWHRIDAGSGRHITTHY